MAFDKGTDGTQFIVTTTLIKDEADNEDGESKKKASKPKVVTTKVPVVQKENKEVNTSKPKSATGSKPMKVLEEVK